MSAGPNEVYLDTEEWAKDYDGMTSTVVVPFFDSEWEKDYTKVSRESLAGLMAEAGWARVRDLPKE